ncbi:hypothetical protein OG819_55215 [Streptomyces sp. NBC_01549]|uniref:hypothetical protein n=1 Tax=Streptomyces sp. NBC_01549 TaxID=2975874 RepID=UPI00225466A1|nr:hypothetical protein [Streptomyces sp. NBC_01549]MCX4598309.1 hypothetical protein [Streptomyces sp. NBC_01549]
MNAPLIEPNGDPVERLGDALRAGLGETWEPTMGPGAPAAILANAGTRRSVGADPDPETCRITLQAWIDGGDGRTPTAIYTADITGHRDLAHWLSCGNLTEPAVVMAQTLRLLLAQLPSPVASQDGGDQ